MARTCVRRVPPVRATKPIEPNVVTRATGRPEVASESKIESMAAGNFWLLLNATSPPSSARDCARTESRMLVAKESMATSAATPSEMDDM